MIRYRSQKQLVLADFEWPFQVALDEQNRWVKLSQCIPAYSGDSDHLVWFYSIT
jgi:hypothetical protein